MLERTAGCLETGTLRRLLPRSQKSLKSRRTLHSGFWNNSALDLEVSPLCSALLQSLDPTVVSCEPQHQASSTVHAGFLFDFLYPAGTLTLLRQYASWGFGRQTRRRTRLECGRAEHRLYTSSTGDSSSQNISSAPAIAHNTQRRPTSTSSTPNKGGRNAAGVLLPAQSSQGIPSLETIDDYEGAWQLYLLSGESKRDTLGAKVIRYLSTSERVVDAERTTEAFEQLDEPAKDADLYIAAIRSYLRLENLVDAMSLHEKAFTDLQFPAGASEILLYLIMRSHWSSAVKFWQHFQKLGDRSPEISYNIFTNMDNHRNFHQRAVRLANYVKRTMGTSSGSSDLVIFASGVAQRALMTSTVSSDELQKLLFTLQEWGRDTVEVYENAITTLLMKKQTRLAVSYYRKARRKHGFKFSESTLESILIVFCGSHSVTGIQQVLDDFFRLYQKPTRAAYRACMTEFASQGDAETVNALFEQYVARGTATGKPLVEANDISPVLHVHARRGELAEVTRHFKRLQDVYKFEPTRLCWNILIDAHAKVHDIEGAFATFEELLSLKHLRPNSHTFGTIMGISAAHGDFEGVVEIYRLALSMEIEISYPMIDCLVQAHIQNERLQEAEKICEDALRADLIGSKTRMWNYLLQAYAMRRDLANVNRLLKRMAEARLEYDEYTYSSLMQALAMAKQPDRAYAILGVMNDAGIRATNYHYAVLMGGYIATKQFYKVFQIQRSMEQAGIRSSASTKLLAMKASDQQFLKIGTEKEQSHRALEMFQAVLSSMDQQDLSASQKGTRHMPRHIAYPSMFFSYVIFVLGQSNEIETAEELYKLFLGALPEDARKLPPVDVLSAMMLTKMRAGDFKGVQECWNLAVSQAKARGMPHRSSNVVVPSNISDPSGFDLSSSYESPKIAPIHQLALTRSLMTYMTCLETQGRVDDVVSVVDGLLKDGFLLDKRNWNLYIQLLVRGQRYKQAFELCEEKLMDAWTGWARVRWEQPERNRLPIELRNKRKDPKHLRPTAHTMLYLARGYLDIQAMSAESSTSQGLLDDLQHTCPRILQAIRSMKRSGDALEREILDGN